MRHDWLVDGAVTVGAAGFVVGTELAKRSIAPASCRWCDGTLNGFDKGVRDVLVGPQLGAARTASDVIGFGVTPLSMLGSTLLLEDKAKDAAVDMLVILEATSLTLATTQVVKFSVARLRPSARAAGGNPEKADDRLSFYSGHTATTFALAMSTGVVLTMRKRKAAPLVWLGGIALATATGVLRIAGDKHYATDVGTGAIVGTSFGVLVPVLFHSPVAERVVGKLPSVPMPYASKSGAGVNWAVRF